MRSAMSSASIAPGPPPACSRQDGQAPAHRLALRHRAQRRQVRRPARHLRADGLRARAAPRRPAPAVRARGGRLRRGGRPALQGDLPRLRRARRPVRCGAGSTRRTPTASPMREAMRHAGLRHAGDDRQAASATRPTTSASSRSTSSRARCSTSSACRSASSPRSTAACASPARCAAWPATPARRRWRPRRDAAAAVAELALYLEKRAAEQPNLVGTIGMLEVPNGSTNVIPGRCRFSLDIRATTDRGARRAASPTCWPSCTPSASGAASTGHPRYHRHRAIGRIRRRLRPGQLHPAQPSLARRPDARPRRARVEGGCRGLVRRRRGALPGAVVTSGLQLRQSPEPGPGRAPDPGRSDVQPRHGPAGALGLGCRVQDLGGLRPGHLESQAQPDPDAGSAIRQSRQPVFPVGLDGLRQLLSRERLHVRGTGGERRGPAIRASAE